MRTKTKDVPKTVRKTDTPINSATRSGFSGRSPDSIATAVRVHRLAHIASHSTSTHESDIETIKESHHAGEWKRDSEVEGERPFQKWSEGPNYH